MVVASDKVDDRLSGWAALAVLLALFSPLVPIIGPVVAGAVVFGVSRTPTGRGRRNRMWLVVAALAVAVAAIFQFVGTPVSGGVSYR